MKVISLGCLAATMLCVSSTNALIPFFKPVKKAAVAVGGAAAVGALAFYLQNKDKKPNLFQPDVDSLHGQTILITGGTTGLGFETAKRLVVGGPKEIILTARSHSKGQAAVSEILGYIQENEMNECRISYKLVDLDNLQGIRDAVERWNDEIEKIDVLCNNAGVMAISERQLTVDGVERQMQSNHLGHFLLTALLAPKLSPYARIINVSSAAYQIPGRNGLDFAYLWKGEPNYGAWKSYGQSKLANIYFSQELQRRAQENGLRWQVAALHPGAVATDLGRYIIGLENWEQLQQGGENASLLSNLVSQSLNLLGKSVAEGANTHVFLASGAAMEPLKAQYFVDCKPQTLSQVATDPVPAKRLWEESEELCQIEFFDMERIRGEAVLTPEVVE